MSRTLGRLRARPMYIRLLSLNNFRNYANLEVELSPGLCIFWGGNGQGKTNLLEAAYFLATTRSFRAEAEREVVRWEAWADPIPAGRIVGHIEAGSGPVTLEVVLHAMRRETAPSPAEGQRPLVHKRIRVNGLAKRAGDAIGEFIAVLFSAPEIHLVDGSPSHRRRYLDTAAVQVDRRYRQVLARYSQVITQRNSLLKAAQEGRARRDELTFWDDEMVKQGAALMLMRRDLVAEVGPRAREVHAHLTEGREELDVEYRPALPLPAVPSTASVAAAFRRALPGEGRGHGPVRLPGPAADHRPEHEAGGGGVHGGAPRRQARSHPGRCLLGVGRAPSPTAYERGGALRAGARHKYGPGPLR